VPMPEVPPLRRGNRANPVNGSNQEQQDSAEEARDDGIRD
jgi:hypothetical protein